MGSVPVSAMNERIRERTDMGGRDQLLFLVTSPIPAQQWSLSAQRNISPTARRKIEKGVVHVFYKPKLYSLLNIIVVIFCIIM